MLIRVINTIRRTVRTGNHAKQGKGTKAPVLPPRPKREEPKVEVVKTIIIPEVITIKELAAKMKLQPSVIVKKLFLQGKVVTINQEVDYGQAGRNRHGIRCTLRNGRKNRCNRRTP